MEIRIKQNAREHAARAGSTVERDAVESILKESWRGTLKSNPHISDLIDGHASKIRTLLGDIDYEIYVVDCVVSNLKGAGRDEAVKYFRTIEALAFGYVKLFGRDAAALMLHGIVVRSKTSKSLRKYYRNMNSEINARMTRLSEKYDKQNGAIAKMNTKLKASEFGILRFFRAGSIKKLRASISKKNMRLEVLERKIVDYATVQSNVHNAIYGIEKSV